MKERNLMIKYNYTPTPTRISPEEMNSILSEYSVFRKLFDMSMYDKEYFGNADIYIKDKGFLRTEDPTDTSHAIMAKMFSLRRFVLSLSADDERLFLFYHYIHGESVGRVGELMKISRRSAFRLKKRALEYAAVRYNIYLSNLCKEKIKQ